MDFPIVSDSLLHPQNFLSSQHTGTLSVTDEEREVGTGPYSTGASEREPADTSSAYASSEVASQHPPTSLSPSSHANSNSESFFSRTPDDIRASTVQLSMLTLLPPRPPGIGPPAHSNYLSPGGPASFPLQHTWSPPTAPSSADDARSNSRRGNEEERRVPGTLNPSQIRTPVTAAELAALSRRPQPQVQSSPSPAPTPGPAQPPNFIESSANPNASKAATHPAFDFDSSEDDFGPVRLFSFSS